MERLAKDAKARGLSDKEARSTVGLRWIPRNTPCTVDVTETDRVRKPAKGISKSTRSQRKARNDLRDYSFRIFAKAGESFDMEWQIPQRIGKAGDDRDPIIGYKLPQPATDKGTTTPWPGGKAQASAPQPKKSSGLFGSGYRSGLSPPPPAKPKATAPPPKVIGLAPPQRQLIQAIGHDWAVRNSTDETDEPWQWLQTIDEAGEPEEPEPDDFGPHTCNVDEAPGLDPVRWPCYLQALAEDEAQYSGDEEWPGAIATPPEWACNPHWPTWATEGDLQ